MLLYIFCRIVCGFAWVKGPARTYSCLEGPRHGKIWEPLVYKSCLTHTQQCKMCFCAKLVLQAMLLSLVQCFSALILYFLVAGDVL